MTLPRPLVDAEARRRIHEDLDTTLVVEAAAGTGKTTELVGRLMALVQSGRGELKRIVAVTFTEKAAGEMKLRFRAEVEKARARPDVPNADRLCLDRALEQLEEAHIGTIHSFCAELLREHPIEARVDPLFDVTGEDDKDRLYDEAFEMWFQRVLAAPPDDHEGVRRVLRRRKKDRDSLSPRDVLKNAGAALVEQRDFDGAWRRDPIDRTGLLDRITARLADLGALASQGQRTDDFLRKNLEEIWRFCDELAKREAVRGRDHDGLEAELRDLARKRSWSWKGGGRMYNAKTPREQVLNLRNAVKAELDRALVDIDADLAACLHAELWPLVEEYERLKARSGRLDFLDLLVTTRDLVRGDAVVRAELQQRFTHVLVDEFQDTDPLQTEILLLLAADDAAETDWQRVRPCPGKLFLVGDPKQSIYRFRRADVRFYNETKRNLVARGAEVLHLSTSFRAVPSIQRAVNAAFAPLMQGPPHSDGQADYVALEPSREEPTGRPTIVALPVPRPYSTYGKVVKWQIEESLPDAVGAFVDWLLTKSGWTVTERDHEGTVPVAARHVCLLFKRFQNFGSDVTRPYVKALEARRVPHVLVGGRSYHEREEVMAVRNALTAIEWPDDELSVYATLRGPFFALTDDALLAWRYRSDGTATEGPPRSSRISPLVQVDAALLPEALRSVAEALAVLRALHLRRNRRPIADTIARLLEATRAHAGVAVWPAGEQALANLLRVMDLARRFEGAGATSFRSFVERLDLEAEKGGASEAPVVEEGTDGVRMMTVHKAKGLEFPVVILVDPTAPMTRAEPSRECVPEKKQWLMPLAGCTPVELVERRAEVLQRDEEESVRLAYVAATRARELLVVPVCGDEVIEGWLDPLRDVVHPDDKKRRETRAAPGCPPFGDDSVLERPVNETPRGPEWSVRPGLHHGRVTDEKKGTDIAPVPAPIEVVWWDPRALELDREDDVGLRQQRILLADTPQGLLAATDGERAHERWQARRKVLLAEGVKPSRVVHTVTELAHEAGTGARRPGPPVLVEDTGAVKVGRPHGRRFGTLVHAVLATVDLAATPAAVAAAAVTQGRILGAFPVEVRAAEGAALAALRHPLLVRARNVAASAVRREAPLLLRQADGSLVEGIVDLAFREETDKGGVWTVIDFKTDQELATQQDAYSAQIALYLVAVKKATGDDARGVLLSV